MPFEERVGVLLDSVLGFYVDFYVSWRFYETSGQISPIWLSYETDMLGDKDAMAAKISLWLGHIAADAAKLRKQLNSDRDGSQYHFNKGVAGRGERIAGANRARVIEAFSAYRDLADWSEILG